MTNDQRPNPEAPPGSGRGFRSLVIGHWSLAIFLLASALYYLTRSPALDEWDSVQFAMGATRGFNLFAHQPHPPGYPLYVFAGWLGTRLGLDVLTALEAASALGGGLFVASWFVLARRATGGARLAGLFAAALAVLPITWMTATKALTDGPAAGLLALELLGASVYRERRSVSALIWTALAGAAATGFRPQNVAVAALILGLALAGGRREERWRWAAGFGTFAAGCLVWLVPTMWLQTHWPEAHGSVWAYPAQLWHQWTWRLDQPKAFVGATGQTGAVLLRRVWLHFGGIFTRGFAFSEHPALGTIGFGLLATGWLLCWRQRPAGVIALLRNSVAWVALYVVIVFGCLPPDQRYYLPVFPLLLLPALAGWWEIGRFLVQRAVAGGRTFPTPTGAPEPLRPAWIAAALPVVLLAVSAPLAWNGHTEAAPPVHLVRWLNAQHPDPAERPRVWLVFRDTRRHAQWYGRGFRVEWAQVFPAPQDWPADWSTAAAIYTDDPAVVAQPLPAPGRTWQPVGQWHRSPNVYRKHNAVSLWRLVGA